MTLLQATTQVLISLALISLVSPYPVGLPQTAENKGRGRSYPLIISHYSNVRNSKYDSPPATEAAPTTPAAVAVESTDLKEKVDDDGHKASTSLVNTDEIKPAADELEKVQQEEKVDESKEKEHVETAAPNMATADSAVVISKNESIPEDSLVPKATEEVKPLQVENVQAEEPKLTEGSSEAPIKESDSIGAMNTKEPTTSSVEADQPAALGGSSNATLSTETADIKEETTEIVQQDDVKPSNDEIKAAVTAQEEVKSESSVESSRTGVLATEKEKTSEFFEEDRSFKDRPEPELILAAIRSSVAALGDESKTLPEKIDDIANEGIRLEREDNKKMSEKKEKEKEKFLLAKPSKEKKPTKVVHDPVQEYDDIITRGGKSKDDSESTTDSTAVVDKALTPEEPITLTLVPDNYPVILPSGESTLSDKVKAEDLETKKVEEPISLVPSEYPVVLPSGESAVSDQVKAEDLKSSPTSEEPATVSSVPTNYPVVLPSGESTLSDKISESPKETKQK